MADSKITALAALTAADPANDMVPIVDVSDNSMAASGTTKRISINNILACSPSATLASLNVTGSSIPANGLYLPTTNTLEFSANSLAQYRIAPLGVFSWYDGAGGTRMTLNSTGLGVGVTPSAWGNNNKVVQVGQLGSVYGRANLGYYGTKFNLYDDNTNNIAISTNFVGEYRFEVLNGSHVWLNKSTAGSIGVAQTLTQAMTLAANGQLLLGTSSTNGSVDIGMVMNKPSATGFVGNVYQLNSVDKAFTYIASAASAYRIDTVAGYTVNVVSGGTNGVYLANGGVAWLALSDERFKDIIEPISNAVAKVGSLRSVIGKFKTDSEGTRRPFLFAQDVQAVLPEAVDATKPEQLGLSYSEVVPLLVAAIKELTARVQTLEAK